MRGDPARIPQADSILGPLMVGERLHGTDFGIIEIKRLRHLFGSLQADSLYTNGVPQDAG